MPTLTADRCCRAGGLWVVGLMLLCIVCMQAVLIGSEWWLGRWSVNAYDQSDSHYLGFYALWMSSMGVITAVRIGVVYERGIVAGTSLHNKLLARVLSATMTFMDGPI